MTSNDTDLLYCVEVLVDASAAHEWYEWMSKTHIPDVMETGCFSEARFCENEPESNRRQRHYEIHYRTTGAGLEEYQRNHATRLQSDHTLRYEGKVEASRRILTVLSRES